MLELTRDFQNDMSACVSATMDRTFYLRFNMLWWVGFKYIHHGQDVIYFFHY